MSFICRRYLQEIKLEKTQSIAAICMMKLQKAINKNECVTCSPLIAVVTTGVAKITRTRCVMFIVIFTMLVAALDIYANIFFL